MATTLDYLELNRADYASGMSGPCKRLVFGEDFNTWGGSIATNFETINQLLNLTDGQFLIGRSGLSLNKAAIHGAIEVDNTGFADLQPNVVTQDNIDSNNQIVHYGATSPTPPFEGQLWVDTNETPYALKVYYSGAWVDNAGEYIKRFAGTPTTQTGNARIDGKFTAAELAAIITTASALGLTIKAAPSQTADLLQVQDSSGTVLLKITNNGDTDFMTTMVNLTNCTINGNLIFNGSTRGRGTTFPVSPAAGDRYEHTGIEGGLEFERVGSAWLSTQRVILTSGDGGSGLSGGMRLSIPIPKREADGISGFYLETANFSYRSGDSHTIADHFDFALSEPNPLLGTSTSITLVSGKADSIGEVDDGVDDGCQAEYNYSITTTAAKSIMLELVQEGAPSGLSNFGCVLTGRWIGVNP